MNWEKIYRELTAAIAIMQSWDDSNEIPQIERDIVLEKLRKSYNSIKFFETEPNNGDASLENYESVGTIRQELSMTDIVEEKPQALENPLNGIISENPAAVSAPTDTEPETAIDATKLFGDDEIPVRSNKGRKTLLSLYGDDEQLPAIKSESENDFVSHNIDLQPDNEKTELSAFEKTDNPIEKALLDTSDEPELIIVAGTSQKPEYSEPYPVRDNAAPQENVTVLGDVINKDEETLADAYAHNSTTTDLASKLSSGAVISLRKSIGINDKFLMMRDMFDGDASAFEAAIDTLDKFDDLDDVMLYIYENYSWNPNSEAVKLMVDLLTRKLS